MQLNPTEAFRFGVILEECLDRLEVLSVMAPEINSESDEAQVVNEEISRIIEEQRTLQSRYEELIIQRTQVKNLSNKSKYKEIQSEIEQVATKLRFATKILCRNLKEDPNIGENIMKIQRERQDLMTLFEVLTVELKEGGYKTLSETLERERKKNEEIKNSVAAVKQISAEIKHITAEISEQQEERKRDEISQNQSIDKLRDDLQELKGKTISEAKYDKKQMKGSIDAMRRVYSQEERDNELKLQKLKRNIEIENQVHKESKEFLEQKQEELQRLTEYWDNKHETDMEEKERQLEEIKSKLAHSTTKLTELKQKHKEVEETVLRDRRLIEAREYHKEVQKLRLEAALLIQQTWRQYRKRKQAKEKLRKLKRAAKKKKGGSNANSSRSISPSKRPVKK